MAAFGTFERMVAMRYLRARRQEGLISVIAAFSFLGIMLGVATLIIVLSVMGGFRKELLGRILGLNGHVTVYGTAGPIAAYDEEIQKLRHIRGVVQAVPIVEGQIMATANGVASGALVRGMRPEDLAARRLVADKIRQSSIAAMASEEGVVVGYRLAQKLRLSVGDPITLVAPQFQATALGSVPRMRAYPVVGTFDVGMFEYDSTFVYMPFEAAQVFFRTAAGATGIELLLDDPDRIDAIRPLLSSILSPEHRLFDWQQANSSYFNAVQVERNVMFLILTLIILVAAFNVVSSMIMLVKEKGRDIAILRTMGATRGMVMRIFFMSGAAVGVLGTLAGFGLGLAFAANIESIRQALQALSGTDFFAAEIYFLSRLPAVVNPREVATVVAMALTLSFLATIYPSWRASRLDPVEALRYE
jgi:lipoprotein-releasing system permease protein